MIAVALNTFDLGEDAARRVVEETQRETGLPATDPVRFDPAPIVDAIAAVPWSGGQVVTVVNWLTGNGLGRRSFPRPFSFQQTS